MTHQVTWYKNSIITEMISKQSGQIIIFHGSLGRISLFQIWNKVRSQKSRNSKWGRIVMFLQTTENPTVYLPNDPNLGIMRNVSWVGGQSLKDLKPDETFISLFSFWLSEAPKSHPKRCAFISKQQNPTVFKNCQTTESISQNDIPSRSKRSEADKRSPTLPQMWWSQNLSRLGRQNG